MTQNTPIKTLTLSPTSRIETIGNKKAFVLNNDTGADAMMFVCQSRADMEDWARDIKRYAEIPEMTSTSSTANGVTPESQLYEGTCMYKYVPSSLPPFLAKNPKKQLK